jgi:glycosyltransferase involved in cell wall biosynthesis
MLSIMILTRNRQQEILRTLQSCIECSLPENTEFVIVDNASQDGTKEAVEFFFQTNLYKYSYCYLSKNVGASEGRNEGLRRTKGRYVYFIDDDAYIDKPKLYFFEKMIGFLCENTEFFCVTTEIYDTSLKDNRWVMVSKNYLQKDYSKVLMFHGGSFLVDKQRLLDRKKLFLDHQFWGMEELYPSLKSYFNGLYIIKMKEINVIHEPSLNTRFDRKRTIIHHYTGAIHVKLIFYPIIVYPLIYLMFCLRIVRHLGFDSLNEAFIQLTFLNKNLKRESISLLKIIKLINEFGFMATF